MDEQGGTGSLLGIDKLGGGPGVGRGERGGSGGREVRGGREGMEEQ